MDLSFFFFLLFIILHSNQLTGVHCNEKHGFFSKFKGLMGSFFFKHKTTAMSTTQTNPLDIQNETTISMTNTHTTTSELTDPFKSIIDNESPITSPPKTIPKDLNPFQRIDIFDQNNDYEDEETTANTIKERITTTKRTRLLPRKQVSLINFKPTLNISKNPIKDVNIFKQNPFEDEIIENEEFSTEMPTQVEPTEQVVDELPTTTVKHSRFNQISNPIEMVVNKSPVTSPPKTLPKDLDSFENQLDFLDKKNIPLTDHKKTTTENPTTEGSVLEQSPFDDETFQDHEDFSSETTTTKLTQPVITVLPPTTTTKQSGFNQMGNPFQKVIKSPITSPPKSLPKDLDSFENQWDYLNVPLAGFKKTPGTQESTRTSLSLKNVTQKTESIKTTTKVTTKTTTKSTIKTTKKAVTKASIFKKNPSNENTFKKPDFG